MKKLFFVIALLLTACSEDLTLPPQISGVVPPTPSNVSLTTADDILYTMTWDVSDPSLVVFYQLYNLDPIRGPIPLDTTVTDSVQLVTPIPTPGIVFGVSSVSTDHIESRIVFVSAP